MKDIRDLVSNINHQAMTEHKEVIIDDFAKNIINKVFDQLSKIFPAWQYNWKTQKEIDGAKMEWTKAFNENGITSLDQIKYGFAHARKSESDFLPSCGKFISWCHPSSEDLGYPSEEQAMRSCISYRNNKKMFNPTPMYTRPIIIELCKRVDWWMMNSVQSNEQQRKASKHFSEVYINLCNSDYSEPQESDDLRLPTQEVVEAGMSDQQKADQRQRSLDSVRNLKDSFKRSMAKKGGQI